MSIDTGQFLQTFYEESFEGLDVMESSLLSLDAGAADPEVVNTIFRAAHSIKGGGGTFGLSDVASFTHVVETLLDEMRNGSRAVTQDTINLLLRAVDNLREMLKAKQHGQTCDTQATAELHEKLEALLGDSASGEAPGACAPGPEASTASGWVITFRPHSHLFFTGNDPARIFRELESLGELDVQVDATNLPPLKEMDPESAYLGWSITLSGDVSRSDLEEVFAWVEDDCDLSLAPLNEAQQTAVAQGATDDGVLSGELVRERRKNRERRQGGDRRTSGSAAGDGTSIRVGIDKVDAVINLVGELVITQSMLSTLGEDFRMNKIADLHKGLAQLERNTRELQEQVMRMRMLPIGFVFNRFPRMVHDLGAQLGKQVNLEISGEGTELDKTVIEKISDPLVHLVRNALDHGIEGPEQRTAAGKPATGTLWLHAYHKGGNIVIEVKDDGRGLDAEKILAKAVASGLVPGDAQLAPEQIYDLLFLPGFSTAEQVSDVSGRGVGMDVVRRNIQGLGGSIEVVSEPGQGSTFTVRLPLTLAIVDGQSVAVGTETYIVPLVSIIESIQVTPSMVNHVAGQCETFRWRDEYLPVVRLHALFGGEARAKQLNDGLIVVVEGEGRRVGLFVDELLGQQQVVIKSLEANYQKVDGVSGATILGDGSVALILDIPGLIRASNQDMTAHEYRKRA